MPPAAKSRKQARGKNDDGWGMKGRTEVKWGSEVVGPEILMLGLANYVFVNRMCPPTYGKLAQSAHKQSPNLTSAPPSLLRKEGRKKMRVFEE